MEKQPMINGVRHSFSSVRIQFLGRDVDGFSAIEYKDSVEKQNNYGAGDMPNHRGRGQYSAECKIKLYQFEVVALQRAAAGKRLQSLPMFNIIVTYLPEGQDTPVVDTIWNCEFKDNGRSLQTGDMMSEHEFDLICSHIHWDGQAEY